MRTTWWMVVLLSAWASPAWGEEARYEGHDAAHWAGQLASRDQQERRQAVYALHQVKNEARPHVRALAQALRDDDKYIRDTANAALLRWKFPDFIDGLTPALPEFLDALQDERTDVRRHAAHLIYLAGPLPNVSGGPAPPDTLVPALIRAMSDTEAKVRANAIAALGNITQLARPALMQLAAALDDDDTTVRRWAIQVMGWIDGAWALPHAIQTMKDAEPSVRVAALGALGAATPPVAEEVLTLIESSLDDADADVRGAAVNALWALSDPRGLPALVKVLKSDDAPRNVTAAHALGALGDPRAVPHLLAALDGPEVVRAAAARSLGLMGPEGAVAVDRLIRILQSRQDAALHASAALSLGTLAPWAERAIPDLIAVMDAADETSASFTASALAQLASHHPDPQLLDAGIRALRRNQAVVAGQPGVASYALPILSPFGPRAAAALPELRALLANDGDRSRNQLHQLLCTLGTSASPLAPLLRAEVAGTGPDAIGAAGALACVATDAADIQQGVDRLATALADPKGRYDAGLAVLFLHHAGARARPARVLLLRALFNERVSRPHVASALFKIGGPGAADALAWLIEHIAGDGDYAVFEVLGRLGTAAQPAVTQLLAVANDSQAKYRVSALETLRKIGATGSDVRAAYQRARADPNARVRTQGALGLRQLGAD